MATSRPALAFLHGRPCRGPPLKQLTGGKLRDISVLVTDRVVETGIIIRYVARNVLQQMVIRLLHCDTVVDQVAFGQASVSEKTAAQDLRLLGPVIRPGIRCPSLSLLASELLDQCLKGHGRVTIG